MATTLSDIVFAAKIACAMADTIESASLSAQVSRVFSDKFGFGTGTGNANQFYQVNGHVLTSGANLDFDLQVAEGFPTETDALRNAVFFDKVRGLLVFNRDASAGTLLVGGHATTPWTDPFNGGATSKLKLPPGSGVLLWSKHANGWSSPGSVHLRFNASGGNCTFDVLQLGENSP